MTAWVRPCCAMRKMTCVSLTEPSALMTAKSGGLEEIGSVQAQKLVVFHHEDQWLRGVIHMGKTHEGVRGFVSL